MLPKYASVLAAPDLASSLSSSSSRLRLSRLREGTNRRKESAMTKFLKLLKDKSGASAAEYALILAIIGSAIAIAALGLGNAIGNRMNNAATCINGGTTADCD
jgi:pilus assembly protein Flp/PilA